MTWDIIGVNLFHEFLALAEWCKEQEIELRFIQPGEPNQNAYVERFNRTYHDVLGAYLFESLNQVREETEKFKSKYNNIRPHDSLKNITPPAFLLKCGKLTAAQTPAECPTFQQEVHSDNYNVTS